MTCTIKFVICVASILLVKHFIPLQAIANFTSAKSDLQNHSGVVDCSIRTSYALPSCTSQSVRKVKNS